MQLVQRLVSHCSNCANLSTTLITTTSVEKGKGRVYPSHTKKRKQSNKKAKNNDFIY